MVVESESGFMERSGVCCVSQLSLSLFSIFPLCRTNCQRWAIGIVSLSPGDLVPPPRRAYSYYADRRARILRLEAIGRSCCSSYHPVTGPFAANNGQQGIIRDADISVELYSYSYYPLAHYEKENSLFWYCPCRSVTALVLLPVTSRVPWRLTFSGVLCRAAASIYLDNGQYMTW